MAQDPEQGKPTTVTVTPDDFRGTGLSMVVQVKMKLDWRVRLGFWLIQFGSWMAGIDYQEEADNS